MGELIKVVLLGLVEGITEFLPISSTGHLIIASHLLQLDSNLQGTFEIFIQGGAVAAVIVFYRHELVFQAMETHTSSQARKLWLGLFVAFLPSGILGFILGVTGTIDMLLTRPDLVAVGLILGGILFIAVEKTRPQPDTVPNTPEDVPVSVRQALMIGLWQVLALIPGMSRSGMSIIGGLITGLDREQATKFSFYLAIPTLGGATVFSLVDRLEDLTINDSFLLVLGMVISGIVGWIAMKWLIRYVANNSFMVFGVYRIAFGLIILIFQHTV